MRRSGCCTRPSIFSARFKTKKGSRFAYKHFNGRIGDSDVHGNLTYTLGKPRPKLVGSKQPLAARMDLQARRLKLKQLMSSIETKNATLGQINGDASFRGNGNSVAKLMAGADGRLTLLIDNGYVSRNLMELAGLNVGNYLFGKLFGDKPTTINCAAADIPIHNGVARPNVFVFDTQDAVINVIGDTDFATEKLDLTITPRSKGFRIFTLRTPLTVDGTYADPSPGVKPGPLIARGAAAVVLGVVGTPAASLLALISPTSADSGQCGPVIHEIKKASAKSDQ